MVPEKFWVYKRSLVQKEFHFQLCRKKECGSKNFDLKTIVTTLTQLNLKLGLRNLFKLQLHLN